MAHSTGRGLDGARRRHRRGSHPGRRSLPAAGHRGAAAPTAWSWSLGTGPPGSNAGCCWARRAPRRATPRWRSRSRRWSSAPAAGTPTSNGTARARGCAASIPGFSLDHLDAYALSRRTLAYRAYRTRNGFLALKIDDAAAGRRGPFRVVPGGPVRGDRAAGLHRARRRRVPPRGRLALRRSGPTRELSAVATVQGVRFHAALSLCDVLAAAPEQPGTWEPSLEVDGVAAPLPLGCPAGRRGRQAPPAALPVRQGRRGADPSLLHRGRRAADRGGRVKISLLHPLRVRHAR